MAVKYVGCSLRVVDANGDVKKVDTWGDAITVTVQEDLMGLIDGLVAETGLLCVGVNEKYQDDAVDVSAIEVPTGQALIKGDLIIARENGNSVYWKGKLPNDVNQLNVICEELITGAKTIGGLTIKEVTPKVNTGRTFRK